MAESSPMMEQYRRIKREHRDEVLFFRLGDFYEMFAEDALEVSSLLSLTLTSRNGSPMCGVPYHAARGYIARLLKHGKKIAICEQIGEAGAGRGLVERRVVEVITPGTTVDEEYLDKGSANYLAALAADSDRLSFAFIDLSAGAFRATAFDCDMERLRRELERLRPRELILQESLLETFPDLAAAVLGEDELVVNRWADWLFDKERGRERLERQFGTANLKGFGLGPEAAEIVASGALLDYLDQTAGSLLPHVRTLSVYGEDDYVGIDEASQRNLELVRNLREGGQRYSLLETMDETRTAMGRRLLKWRILHPLRDVSKIRGRLDLVSALYRAQGVLASLRDAMAKTPDLERLCSRVAMDRAHGKDLAAVQTALSSFRRILELSRELGGEPGGAGAAASPEEGAPLSAEALERLEALRELLARGLCDEPSILLTEGKLIRPGFDPELDELIKLRDNGRGLLEAYLAEEREATGMAGLKIKYNRLIGYFFEVSKANLPLVPAHFIRRQGMAGGERFTTDRLAALESEINGASDRVVELERRLFLRLRDEAKTLIPELLAAARRMAELDVAQSLARSATVRGWVRPEVDGSKDLRILEGRHPVVEAHLPRGEFVPNDLLLEGEGVGFALITGPNMAGKSTYLRQAALMTIMAQVGSFVPAREASIGIVDRIFCRVGASDNLARGESTFLVEMNETANILHSATDRSLVIMDEVGRGTGTADGLSIAWAVCEELLESLRCRTLFATHYHELSRIRHRRMANRSMEVLERDGEVVFLRKLREGATRESYGLHVARLAGLPDRVVDRAEFIMERLRESEAALQAALPMADQEGGVPSASPGNDGDRGGGPRNPARNPAASGERNRHGDRVLRELRSLDPDRLTPLEALARLHAWTSLLRSDAAPAASTGGAGIRRPGSAGPSLFD